MGLTGLLARGAGPFGFFGVGVLHINIEQYTGNRNAVEFAKSTNAQHLSLYSVTKASVGSRLFINNGYTTLHHFGISVAKVAKLRE